MIAIEAALWTQTGKILYDAFILIAFAFVIGFLPDNAKVHG
jgi:hypothetical protein